MAGSARGLAREKKLLLVQLCMSAFLWPFLTTGANIALPAIAAEYGVDAVSISWVTNVALLFTAIFLLPAGKLIEALGPRRMMLAGIGTAVLSTLAVALAGTYPLLLLLRGVQGFGGALISTSSMTFATSEFEGEQRGFAIGVYTASIYLGSSAGPFLGGLLVSLFAWRGVFYFITLLSLAAFVPALSLLPRPQGRPRLPEGFDFLGSVIYAAGLCLIVAGMDRLGELRWAAATGAGVAVTLAFLLYERFAREPVFDVKLFRGNRAFALSCLACLISYAAVYAVAYLLSLYLQHAKGLTPRAAGFVLVVQPLVQTLVSPLSGRLSGRVEPNTIASCGMGVTALGTFILIWLGVGTSVAYVVAAEVVLGVGFALFAPPNSNSVMSSVTPEQRGVAAGMLGSLRFMGQLFSMMIATIVFSLAMGHVDVTPETMPAFLSSVRLSFAIMTVMCGASAAFSAWQTKGRDEKK